MLILRKEPYERIMDLIENIEFMKIPKFKNFLSKLDQGNEKDKQSYMVIKGEGGRFLKGLGSSIHFLKLLVKKYKGFRFSDDSGRNAMDIEIEKDLNLNDRIQDFMTKIRVTYYSNHSLRMFEIDISDPHKQKTYTFRHLKEDACNYWNIPNEMKYSFQIVDEKKKVYSPRINVYSLHSKVTEANKTLLRGLHCELVSRLVYLA